MFVMCLLVSLSLSGVVGRSDSVMAEAVKQAVTSSFSKSATLLDVTVQTEYDDNKIVFLDMLDGILNDMWSLPVQLDVNNQGNQSVDDYNLWFIDSYEAFRRLLPLIRLHGGDSPVFYFIILKLSTYDGSVELMQKLFSDMFILMVANVNILMERTAGEVLFYTFFPFEESHCRSTEPILIDRFTNKIAKSQQLFPAKANNLNGCPIRMAARNIHSFLRFSRSNNVSRLEGLEGEILNELAARMNFTFEIVRHRLFSKVLPNGTATGLFKMLEDGEVDMIVGFQLHDPNQDRMFTPSTTYFYTWLVIALIRPPYKLPKLSWLFAAFDGKTWACIIMLLTVTAGCIVIATANTRLAKFLDLQPNRPRVLHTLAVAIGMSIKYLPKKNILRFCFIIWSLGVLIIRATYQGKLFNSYRRVIVTKAPLTVVQLLDQHYTIYSRHVYAPIINQLSGIGNVNYKELTQMSIISNKTHNNAIVSSQSHIMAFFKPLELENVITEPLYSQQVCMFFQQHSVMAQRANAIILWMEKAGLLQRLRAKYKFVKNVNSVAQETYVPGPISLNRFQYIILSFAMIYAVAGVVFVLELCSARLRKGRTRA